MVAIPPALQIAFDNWDRAGRPAQRAFTWKRAAWDKWLPDFTDTLLGFPNPIDRSAVASEFTRIDDESSAINAYVASYVWGYAEANNGPFRAKRVIESNAHFACDLVELGRVAQIQGGVAAFDHVVVRHRGDRDFFSWWGPAFATKFIYFATKASPEVEITPVLDSRVATWFVNNVEDMEPLALGWKSSESYVRYVERMAKWGAALSIEVDQVEQLIFTDRSPAGMINKK